MTELAGHDGHDSYAYVQLRAAQNDLADAIRREREIEVQLEATKELAADLFERLKEDDAISAWIVQRMKALGIDVYGGKAGRK